MFKFDAYKTVHTKKLADEATIDMKALQDKDKRDAEVKAAMEHNARLMEDFRQGERQKLAQESAIHGERLEAYKSSLLTKMATMVPDQLVAEGFAHIYVKACNGIHDSEYVAEHFKAFNDMAHMYIRKLGGIKYLKEQAAKVNSPFLTGFYNICVEAAKNITKEKSKEMVRAMTEDEALEILNGAIGEKDKNELIEKIDDLGADQLAELIKNKVVNVVRDEQIRERDEREMRTVLKNDLISGDGGVSDVSGEDDDEIVAEKKGKKSKKDEEEEAGSEDLPESDVGDDEAGEDEDKEEKPKKKGKKKSSKKKDDDEEGSDEGEEDLEDEPEEDEEGGEEDKDASGKKSSKKKKEAKESLASVLSRWDPVNEELTYDPNRQGKSLFFAINVAISRDMLKSAHVTEGASVTKVQEKKVPQAVLENPLNLDIFNVYLKDNQDGFKDIDESIPHEPQSIGSTDPIIDPSSVMSEALIQYTLLEAAHTMKLILPTKGQVKQQSDYLLNLL
jgi:hypothetical protein